MILTTGFDVQGYFITEYIDVLFDEMLVGLGFGKSILSGLDNFVSALTGSEATEMITKLNTVKTQLRNRLVKEAQRRGADALIGIDFESSRLGDLIMVSMTATAVKLDKIESPLPVLRSDTVRAQEAEKQRQREEESAQRLAKAKAAAEAADFVFNPTVVLNTLPDFKTTKEVVNYIAELAQIYPDIFDENIIAQLDHYLKFERIYGDCRSDVINIVQKHLKAVCNL